MSLAGRIALRTAAFRRFGNVLIGIGVAALCPLSLAWRLDDDRATGDRIAVDRRL